MTRLNKEIFNCYLHSDTAIDVLTGKVDCDSEVTGIEFNQQLKQVATSHHTYIQDAAAHVVNRVIEKIIYLILKKHTPVIVFHFWVKFI